MSELANAPEEWIAKPWTEVFGGTAESNPALRHGLLAFMDLETKTAYFGFALPVTERSAGTDGRLERRTSPPTP